MNKPTPFGKYYLIERVNVGGMAEVFKAKVMGVEGFERIVALKRILPHIAEDEEFITMFIDEAKIAVQLQHANIAQIFDLGKVDEAYFIALEYVHGRDMRGIYDDLHRRRQLMPTPQICFVIMQVCEGLDYAHNKRDQQGRSLNLVHRDVSPQNILVGFEGEVKLIDFGIAKAAGKASKTQAGILKGKFGYMSPEQVRGLAIDRRSDIFALGIILYEMLTGERLFVGESDFSTLEKVRNVEIIPPSSINSQIPEQLERIVLKALAKDVEDRYQNALDLHDDLQAFLYTTGKFSSRKDLSAWMKRSFPSAAQPEEVVDVNSSVEIQDVDELEDDTEELTPGAQAKAEHRRREQGLGWDDEELETSIYDRPGDGVDSPRPQMGDRTFDSDDKTVAAAPSEAILAEMGEGFSAPSTFAEKAPTHRDERPTSLRQTMMGVGHTPPARPLPLPPAARLTGSPSAPTRPSTMMGQARASSTMPTVTPGPQAPLQMGRPILTPLGAPASEPHRPAPLRQTLMGVGVPSAPLPGGRLTGGMAAPPSLFPPQPLVSLDPAQAFPPGAALPAQGYGARLTAGMDIATTTAAAMSLRPSSKLKYYLLFLAFMALGGGGAYMYLTRPGKIQIAVKPQDARVTVDGKTVENGPPYVIEKRPGIYHVAAAREGYVSREQNVEIRAGQVERTEMELEPSPDTGFELTSQPPGGLVWLDGQAFAVNETGKQATTNFRASRISPGRHVLEIKGDPKFKDWRQEIYQEPGQTLRIHAERELITGGARPGAAAPAPGSRPTSAPTAAAPAPTPAPTARPSTPSPAPAPAAASDDSRGKTGSGSRRSGGRVAKTDDTFEDPFAGPSAKPAAPPAAKPKSKTVTDEDIFATLGASPSASGGGGSDQCTATIGSKPWAQVAIDGKPTGKSTPLMDYSLPCGKHRITFTNPDLMIERNEIIILKAGQRFKKIFPLVDMDF